MSTSEILLFITEAKIRDGDTVIDLPVPTQVKQIADGDSDRVELTYLGCPKIRLIKGNAVHLEISFERKNGTNVDLFSDYLCTIMDHTLTQTPYHFITNWLRAAPLNGAM